MYILVDTETSGKPLDYKAPPSDFASWGTARMVQLAWIEYDENGKKLSAHDYLIKPDGFHIPMDAIEVHGITNERAHEKGIPVKQALDLFREALSRHPYMVAHNVDFDKNVIGSEFLRLGGDNPVDAVFTVCTMKSTVNFVQAKGFGGRYKWPKLSELHMKLFNTKFDGAHDALVDTEALGRCFFKLQELGILGFKTVPEKRKLFGKDKTAELPKEELFKPVVAFGVHTFYSLLRGGSSVDDYVKRANDFGHKALVLTDRGNVSGSFEFYQKCKKAGIKPIIGCEFLLNNNIGLFENPVDEGGSYVQKVIIKDKSGYSNLNKLLFLSHSKGFRSGESRITTDWLIENKEGLMVSTSGHEGYVADLLEKGKRTEAKAHILRLKEAFGDDLFVEIKFSELTEQKVLNEFLLVMAAEHQIMTIMDNDVHYALPNGNELQDTVYTMSQNGAALSKARLFDRRHLFLPNRRNYIEFNKKFEYHYPEKVIEKFMDNSLLLAERCNFEFEIGVEKYPAYEPTQDVIDFFKTSNTEEIIYRMAKAKLKKKLVERDERRAKKGEPPMTEEERKVYFDRLQYELDVIKSKNALDYFMVNWEILRDYREKGHETGAGRGSAAGCLLSWVLDITKIDPLKFGLYFERFMNPTRQSMPDIDVDFESGTDEIVDDFLFKKYGRERVMPVGTYSTFNEKGCLKDVVRAHYGVEATGDESEVNQVTKEMPDWLKEKKLTLKDWFENYPSMPECSPVVKRWLQDPRNEVILEQTLQLQGQVRGFGKHAAGVIITPRESWHDVPSSIIAKHQGIITAFSEADGSSKDLSALGILKLDRLKLSTMNIIMDAIKMIKHNTGVDITDTIMHIDEHFDDKNLYAELRLGLNHGVFQFESAGINSLIRGINIESFDEVVAANALFRPGPMGIDAHTEYIHNKFNPTEIEYAHPALESVLAETNGVMIFQEQVQFIANKIAGMSLGEGDMLRRYMDKASKIISKMSNGVELEEKDLKDKDYQNFLKYWEQFLSGAAKQGYNERDVNKIRDYMVKYLGYSFNKSHSVSYGFIAMQTLYLKHYYPTEFYTSLLNNAKNTGPDDKKKAWMENAIASAISKGITVRPPSRRSQWECSTTGEKEISLGFSMINGFGEAAYEELLDLLRVKKKTLDTIAMTTFFELPFSKFNKSAFEACMKAGVFDDWSTSREFLMSLKTRKKKKPGDPKQLTAFDMEEVGLGVRVDDSVYPPASDGERLAQFIEVCGFDIRHIERIAKIKKNIEEKASAKSKAVEPITNFHGDDSYYFFLNDIRHMKTKQNKEYLQLIVGDGISKTKLHVFEPMVERIVNDLERNAVYLTQFVKNEKGFINMKRNCKFKKIVHAYSTDIISHTA